MTEADDHLFCLITMNHHPLHINDHYAAQSQQGRNVVVGPLVYSLAVGMTVGDVSGKAIANLATEDLSHPNPVFHGDTLFCESEVLDVGRTTRVVPAAIRRALALRDKGCAHPGCTRPHHWCDAHHKVHWVDGGETSLDNLVLLCRRHHRMVHEGAERRRE